MPNTDAPVRFTESAKANLRPLVQEGKMPEPFIRVGMKGGTCGGTYVLGFDSKTEFDEEYLIDDIPLLIDRRQLLFVLGTEIDFEARANGFYLHKPTVS
ncbi:HesB/IscA family protein [Aquirufa sp. OSTEICH-129A]